MDHFYAKMCTLLQKSLEDLGQDAGHTAAPVPSSAFRETRGSELSFLSVVTTVFPRATCSTQDSKCSSLFFKVVEWSRLSYLRRSYHGAAEMNLTRNHEVAGLIPGLAQGVKDLALL